ncbi:hypothetical protein [Methylogaea oryzae]|uniref:hypothetical protein n=1 Tax=Methylogaea oryzae TaxID=1295382 RepID=UPI0006D1DDAE|nr:hypothetical protein [Methylogaea oryzae]
MSPKPPALHRFGWRYLLPPLLLGGGLIAYLWQWQLAQNGMALADLWAKLPKNGAVFGWLGLALSMDWLRDFAICGSCAYSPTGACPGWPAAKSC